MRPADTLGLEMGFVDYVNIMVSEDLRSGGVYRWAQM